MQMNTRNCGLIGPLLLLHYYRSQLNDIFVGMIVGAILLHLANQVRRFGFRITFLKDNTQTNKLFRFIKDGNLDEIKKIRRKFPKEQFFEMKPFGGYNMLMFAASEGHLDIIKYLVEEGANVNERSNNGETPLIRACYFNRLDIAQYLISAKANIEHVTTTDLTPLQVAIMRNKPNMVTLLLNKGAKLRLKTKNLLAEEKIQNMTPELLLAIFEFTEWQRIKQPLKYQTDRDKQKNYPKEFMRLNKNIMHKVLSEYI
ncbi:ankyrin repeat [Stylonychia lemnae]|uniref:Ankyrin repeat n=1 Tax=Stylonychia lemnae TaxID=5949 RepID=A0A078AGC8_STYLE|nr:ankyrin repeat [Stylonychia lemnae]|eukprot:CDW81355.1 ankyrin repeat [Stylonychia lemnae]